MGVNIPLTSILLAAISIVMIVFATFLSGHLLWGRWRFSPTNLTKIAVGGLGAMPLASLYACLLLIYGYASSILDALFVVVVVTGFWGTTVGWLVAHLISGRLNLPDPEKDIREFE